MRTNASSWVLGRFVSVASWTLAKTFTRCFSFRAFILTTSITKLPSLTLIMTSKMMS